jgi:hypothetical protein
MKNWNAKNVWMMMPEGKYVSMENYVTQRRLKKE